MKILLSIDGSNCSEAVVNRVAGQPWPEGSGLKILSATNIPNVSATEARVLPGNYSTGPDNQGRRPFNLPASVSGKNLQRIFIANCNATAVDLNEPVLL